MLQSPDAVERALTIFEYSEFLTDILVRHPEDVSLLKRDCRPPRLRQKAIGLTGTQQHNCLRKIRFLITWRKAM